MLWGLRGREVLVAGLATWRTFSSSESIGLEEIVLIFLIQRKGRLVHEINGVDCLYRAD